MKLKRFFFSQIRAHFVALRSELLLCFVYEKFFSFCLTSLVLAFFLSKFTVLSFLSLALSWLCAQLTTSTHLIHRQLSLRAVIPTMGICFGKCSKAALLTGAGQRQAYYTNIECTGLNLPLRTEPFEDEPFVNQRHKGLLDITEMILAKFKSFSKRPLACTF